MNLSIFRPSYATTVNPVDHLFDSLWNNAWPRTVNSTISPRVDVYDQDKNLIVEAELPGVNKSDVSVSFERGILTIKAEKKATHEAKGMEYYFGERSMGTYERSFRLSEDIDADSVKASFENGVLRLEMARKPEAAGRKIEVH